MDNINQIAILGRTTSTAEFLGEKLELDYSVVMVEKDPPYKTYGLNNLTIFTDIEPENINSRWLTECGQRDWEIIFVNEIIESIKIQKNSQ